MPRKPASTSSRKTSPTPRRPAAPTASPITAKSFRLRPIRQSGSSTPGLGLQGVRVSAIKDDKSEGQSLYDPQHPDADASGYVKMPNVNMAYEMIDLMTASRAYEANLSVVKNSRQMAMRSLEIGK